MKILKICGIEIYLKNNYFQRYNDVTIFLLDYDGIEKGLCTNF
jgi:hypothetical protein